MKDTVYYRAFIVTGLFCALLFIVPTVVGRPIFKPCHGHSCPTASPGPTPTPTPTATPTATPTPTPTPTPVPTPPPPTSELYGSAIEADSKDNRYIGYGYALAYTFRARGGTTTSAAINVRSDLPYSQNGLGYSWGTGGTLVYSFERTTNGLPNGTVLGQSAQYQPGNPAVSDREVSIPIAVTATLPAGEVVALVIRNVDPDPINNWISANCFTLNDGTSRVLWAPDMKVLDWKSSRGWAEYANSPVFDVTYSDGGHDGQAYYAVTPNYYGTVNGSQMIRERFTPTSDVTIGSASVRVKRTVGTGAIVLSLKQGTTQLAVGSVAASFAPISPPPDPIGGRWDEASLAGGRWATITFPAFTLTAGTTYDLVVSTDSATTYLAIPIRENAGRVDGSGFTNSPPSPVWGSRAFREGQGEKYNGSWVAMYDYAPHDLQFYFE